MRDREQPHRVAPAGAGAGAAGCRAWRAAAVRRGAGRAGLGGRRRRALGPEYECRQRQLGADGAGTAIYAEHPEIPRDTMRGICPIRCRNAPIW